MNRAAFASLSLAALVAGCAAIPRSDGPRQPEFVGRSIQMQTAAGQTTLLSFAADGTVRAQFGERSTAGRWSLERRQLCFTWAGNFRECWPYTQPFRRGRTVALTSDRGNALRVTLR